MSKKITGVHNRVAARPNYYWIFGVEHEQPDAHTQGVYKQKPWVVNFGVSTDRGDLDDKQNSNKLSVAELKKMLTEPYKGAPSVPYFEFELSKNWHTARAETKEQAEQLAAEITYIFRNNGVQPMDEDEAKYPAKIPGTDTIVAFTPPRHGG